MDDRASRVFVGLCVLVLLWIGVYWLWQPGTPGVTHAAEPRRAQTRPTEHQDPTNSAPSAGAEPRENGVVAPGFREYRVRDGDSFERIAERELGDASLWTVVARANPLKDPRRLRSGQTLRLPLDVENVQGAPRQRTTPEPPASTPESEMATYVVRGGDTLSGISAAHYGSSAHARLIYEANTDTLSSMHALRVGQTLRLPPIDADD